MKLQLVKKVAGKTMLFLKSHGPTIMTYLGIGGTVTAGVLACKATLKVEPVIDEAKEEITLVKEREPEETKSKALTKTYISTAGKLAKLYWLPAGVGAVSIGLIVGGHTIMCRRYTALTAAYMGLSEAFNKYRDRVKNDQGEDKDIEYYYGKKAREVEFVDESGNVTKEKIYEKVDDGVTPYFAVFAKDTTALWSRDRTQCLKEIKAAEVFANQKLMFGDEGFVTLQSVMHALGFYDYPLEAFSIGWIRGLTNHIDFGIDYEALLRMNPDDPEYTNEFRLEFNIDGPMGIIFAVGDKDYIPMIGGGVEEVKED